MHHTNLQELCLALLHSPQPDLSRVNGGKRRRKKKRCKRVKGATQGQGVINISVITETGERWEGQCPDVSCVASLLYLGQGVINISVITETGERWEGQCPGVSCVASLLYLAQGVITISVITDTGERWGGGGGGGAVPWCVLCSIPLISWARCYHHICYH